MPVTSAARPTTPSGRVRGRPATTVAAWLAAWSLSYAAYRGYYAAGGTVGMIGVPVSTSQFRAVNAAGAAVIALAGLVALAGPRVAVLRRALPVRGWLGGVGCCMHALVDTTLRLLSLTGVHPTVLPATFWLSFDRQLADLQDLLLNEPWFLVEGLLWGALGLAHVAGRRRRAWLTTAVVACALLTVVGVLSGLDVIGSFVLA
jgi:hypothetical protein